MAAEGANKRLILAAMIFAVSMTFTDQTIVAIAVPELQKDLSLSSTGVQWIINGYLLLLSALFAFGGRLADSLSQSGGGDSGNFAQHAGAKAKELFAAVQHDFALSTRTVFYVMAAVMAVAFVVALVAMPGGKAPQQDEDSASG